MRKNLPKILAAAICLIISAPNIYSQAPPPPAEYTEIQKVMFKKANERFGIYSGRVVEINRNGIIYDIRTKLINIGLTATDPAERAYQFFERHKDLYQIPEPRKELVVQSIVPTDSGSGVIMFDQAVGGVKVYQGGCQVYFDSDSAGAQLNRVKCQYTGLLPDAHNINPVPTIDSLEAGSIAQADPAHEHNETYVTSRGLWIASDYYFGIRPFPDRCTHLVWHLFVNNGGYSGEAEYFIDAHSGQILLATSAYKGF